MTQPTTLKNRESGFTLIELSIVLVIIGLIVGGVLVGQDLIKAAELRAAIAQLEKYDTAVNTFRTKYNGVPGDVQNPATFGFNNTGMVAANAGNGVLDASTSAKFDQEAAAFFRHLSQANMIPEAITGTDFTTASVDAVGDYMPASKLGKGIYVMTVSNGGLNYYVLDKLAATDAVLTYSHFMTPLDAFSMDSKIDDGNPTTGKMVAVDDLATAASSTANAGALSGKCVDSTAVTYQVSSTAIGSQNACTLRVRASF